MTKNDNHSNQESNVKNLQKALHQFEFDLARLPVSQIKVASSTGESAHLTEEILKKLDEVHFELQAIKKSFQTFEQFSLEPCFDSSFNLVWKQFLAELRCQLSLKLEGKGTRLSVYSRLSVWERLWTAWRWQYGFDSLEYHRLSLRDLKDCLGTCRALTAMTWYMKSDPLWSPTKIRQAQSDFFSEASLCYALNQFSSHLSFGLAPLEADILAALDISVKRAKPNRAKAWFQFSLSAEKSLNNKKLSRLNKSAAIALISPYTLTLFLKESSDNIELRKIYDQLKLGPKEPAHIMPETYARELAKLMKKLFAVSSSRVSQYCLDGLSSLAVMCQLIEMYVEHYLGQKSRIKYRAFKVDYQENPLVINLLHQGSES